MVSLTGVCVCVSAVGPRHENVANQSMAYTGCKLVRLRLSTHVPEQPNWFRINFLRLCHLTNPLPRPLSRTFPLSRPANKHISAPPWANPEDLLPLFCPSTRWTLLRAAAHSSLAHTHMPLHLPRPRALFCIFSPCSYSQLIWGARNGPQHLDPHPPFLQ